MIVGELIPVGPVLSSRRVSPDFDGQNRCAQWPIFDQFKMTEREPRLMPTSFIRESNLRRALF
jgi:hypothetical protein